MEPIDIIPSKNNGPYAFRTKLGWCIVGPVNESDCRKEMKCHKIAVKQAPSDNIAEHYFQTKSDIKESEVSEMLTRMYNQEFSEAGILEKGIERMSKEDKKFMKILNDETQLVDKHYKVPLPFRSTDVYLPNNRYQAKQRLSYLERKFNKNERFKEDYIRFMDEIIAKGYARKAVKERESGKTWYLPHHGVYHPNKPEKIRIVFDLSAEYKGRSLNKELLSGPDLTNQIVGVLLRFREEQVAVIADIEGMFHQVKVPDKQCGFLRFLWWDDSNTEKDVIDNEMTVHVFGGVSSPSCSNIVINMERTSQKY